MILVGKKFELILFLIILGLIYYMIDRARRGIKTPKVRELAEEKDVLLLDLEREFSRLPAETVRTEYFRKDGVHLTANGDMIIAGVMHRLFRQEGIFDIILTQD